MVGYGLTETAPMVRDYALKHTNDRALLPCGKIGSLLVYINYERELTWRKHRSCRRFDGIQDY